MEFLGLSLLTWQTLLIIGFPLIYKSFSRLKPIPPFIPQHLFKPSSPSPSSSSDKTPKPNSSSPKLTKIRARDLSRIQTILLALLLSSHLYHYIIHRPSKRNVFRLTNHPINIPSTTLASSLTRHYRSIGLTDTPLEQERLLRKLNTLDARLLYSTLGPDAFLHCTWCRPPSGKNSTSGMDHLVFTASRLILSYSILFLSIGLMTTGASQLGVKRKLWRTKIGLLATVWMISELIILSILVFMPTLFINGSLESTVMTWDGLYHLRFILFSSFLILAWYSVITETPKDPLSGVPKLGFGLAGLAAELDGLVNRLRLTALQRSALMRDGDCRSRIDRFWENAERQAQLATRDPKVQALKDSLGLSSLHHDHRDQLRNWIELVYPDPSLGSDPTTPPISPTIPTPNHPLSPITPSHPLPPISLT